MKKISSDRTFFYKRFFPVIWFGVLFLIMAAVYSGILFGPNNSAPIVLYVVPGFLLALGSVLMWFLIFDLADEVFDAGDHLVVNNNGREKLVPLSEIEEIDHRNITNPPRVTLYLRSGGKVTFIPIMARSGLFAVNFPAVDSLIERTKKN